MTIRLSLFFLSASLLLGGCMGNPTREDKIAALEADGCRSYSDAIPAPANETDLNYKAKEACFEAYKFYCEQGKKAIVNCAKVTAFSTGSGSSACTPCNW
jgi:hypothetical protein